MHILIVEDDDSIREACVELLESEGFSVDACANGKEALASLERLSEPCLILLDMMMPIMNGREFMLEFAKRPHTIAPIPVYLVSAAALEATSKGIGCLGFLKKPFEMNALLAIVRAHCGPKAA
ncbi:MAG: response regulator [Bdellovibrionota bacterium]